MTDDMRLRHDDPVEWTRRRAAGPVLTRQDLEQGRRYCVGCGRWRLTDSRAERCEECREWWPTINGALLFVLCVVLATVLIVESLK